mgnify:CR=1 FL=1|jgi:hypothetical protein
MRLVVVSSRRYNGDLTTTASSIDNCPARHRDVGDSTSAAREEHRHGDATFYTHFFTCNLFHMHAPGDTHHA